MSKSQRFTSFLYFFRLSIRIPFLLLAVFLINTVVYAQQNYDVETKLLSNDGASNDEFGRSVSISGNTAIVGAIGDDGFIGSAYIFHFDGSVWIQQQKLTASDGAAYDNFGHSVSISENTAIIGASGDDNYLGSAYIFQLNGSTWLEQQKLTASDGETNDQFGGSVSISENTVIVGAEGDDAFSGSAYIFQLNGSTWLEQQKLTAGTITVYDFFGQSVSVNGTTAIVGAYGDDNSIGSAYIFQLNGGTWLEKQKLIASDGEVEDQFGRSVSISENKVIIGAYGNFIDNGSAYIFKLNDGTWMEQQKLTASDGAAGDGFGTSVSISGNIAIVGASLNNISGSAYGFYFNGASWAEQKLTASDGAADDRFGQSVAVSDNIAIVGAYKDDNNGNESGSAYIYELIATPDQVEVADGIYNNLNKISWNNRSGSVENFKIYRNGEYHDITIAGAQGYNDYDAVPGKIYTYGVSAYNSNWGNSAIVSATGWQRANGRLDGVVSSSQGAGVADVNILASLTADLTNCLNFDGVEDYVEVPDNPNFNLNQWTIEAWVYPQSGDYIISRAVDSIITFQIQYLPSTQNISTGFQDENELEYLVTSSTNSVPAGEWTHIAGIYDGSTLSVYINGQLNNSLPASATQYFGSASILIGKGFNISGTGYFEGKIDEIRLWDTVRDSVAIQGDMRRLLQGNEPGLLAYWTFDDSSRTSATIAGDYAEGGR